MTYYRPWREEAKLWLGNLVIYFALLAIVGACWVAESVIKSLVAP